MILRGMKVFIESLKELSGPTKIILGLEILVGVLLLGGIVVVLGTHV